MRVGVFVCFKAGYSGSNQSNNAVTVRRACECVAHRKQNTKQRLYPNYEQAFSLLVFPSPRVAMHCLICPVICTHIYT